MLKDFKLLIKNWGFWVIVYAFIVTIALIIISVLYSNHVCETLTKEKTDQIIDESNKQIEQYEKQITKDSIRVWLSDRNERDSLRAIRFKQYTGK